MTAQRKKLTRKLTAREARFVEAYTGSAAGNGLEAAVTAGYARGSAKVTASRLLRKAPIADAIANRKAEIANHNAQIEREEANHDAAAILEAGDTIADAIERRRLLTHLARTALEDPAARIRAIDVLNKMDGLYVKQHRLGIGAIDGGPVTVQFIEVPSGATEATT